MATRGGEREREREGEQKERPGAEEEERGRKGGAREEKKRELAFRLVSLDGQVKNIQGITGGA